jgi:hypothetical protein
MRRVSLLVSAWISLAGPPVGAQDWVARVLPERSYDFGTVARGSRVHHTFRLVNTTDQEIQIADWRTKCGCTDVRVGARNVPPGTQTKIEAVVDTTKFQGYKASGLTLVLSRPSYVEIDLNLTCFIRGDIVVNPGQVDFGIVTHSAKPSTTLNLTYSGGQPNWGVSRMQTRSRHVAAKLQELSRSPGGHAEFALAVTFDPSEVTGTFRDEITLTTNDPSSPTIPISVAAQVKSAVTVSPSVIDLGRVRPGAVVTKRLLVRAAQPFKLTAL